MKYMLALLLLAPGIGGIVAWGAAPPRSNPQPAPMSFSKEVLISAPLAKVWNAFTTSEAAQSFFAPRAEIEPVVGGKYELYFLLDMPEGSRGSEGCKVRSLAPMKRLWVEWNAPPQLATVRKIHTQVILDFEAAGENRTRVRLKHFGFGQEEEWRKAYAYFDRGWDLVLVRLEYRFTRGPIDWKSPYTPPAK